MWLAVNRVTAARESQDNNNFAFPVEPISLDLRARLWLLLAARSCCVSSMSESTEDTAYETLTDPKHFSRLLYTNPVCFLTTVDAKHGRHNSMVISWLTPINNHGVFIMAVNKMRCTASLLLERRSFGLSVAVRGQEAALLAVGRCHGHNVDKFAALKLTKLSLSDAPEPEPSDASSARPVNPFAALGESESDGDGDGDGDGDDPPAAAPLDDTGVAGSAAVLQCRVLAVSDSVEGDGADSMHHIVTAVVTAARVSRAHWNGKQFGAFAPGAAPTLSFLGSQEFAYVTPAPKPQPTPAGT